MRFQVKPPAVDAWRVGDVIRFLRDMGRRDQPRAIAQAVTAGAITFDQATLTVSVATPVASSSIRTDWLVLAADGTWSFMTGKTFRDMYVPASDDLDS